YAAWDRFDYVAAAAVPLPAAGPSPSEWDALIPAPEIRRWLADLSRTFPADNPGRAEHLRRLTADLLANGERRIRDQQYEEALLRASRILELLGEIRLFARNVDPIHEQLNRHAALGRLDTLRDPLASELRKQANLGIIKATDRHQSLLTHGYEPV